MFRLCVVLAFVLPLSALAQKPPRLKLPENPPGWSCPIGTKGKIAVGNEVAPHDRDHNKYAWDYDVRIGTAVVATRSGKVIVSFDHGIARTNEVMIQHSDGTMSVFRHLKRHRNTVLPGHYVIAGEKIGEVGKSGTKKAHLEYQVAKQGRGKVLSQSSKFDDFEGNGGVPVKADQHGPAKKPAISQKLLTLFKRCYLAAENARRYDWPEIGLAFTQQALSAGGKQGYYYRRLLEKYHQIFHKRVLTRIEELANDKQGGSYTPLMRTNRMIEALRGNRAFGGPLEPLKQVAKGHAETAKTMALTSSVVRAYIAGMKLECAEQTDKALKTYLSIRHGNIKRRTFAQERINLLINDKSQGFKSELKQLAKDAAEVSKQPGKKSELRSVTNAVKRKADSFMKKTWLKWSPDDKELAKEFAEEIATATKEILDKLK